MNTPAVSVAMLDDNSLVTEAVERWLLRMPVLKWCGWTARVEEIRGLLRETNPDVLLLDFELPGHDTLALIRSLRGEFPATRIVVLSGYLREDNIRAAIEAGVDGYVGKDERVLDIAAFVEQAARGQRAFSAAAEAALAGQTID